jgi:hypothetical protein
MNTIVLVLLVITLGTCGEIFAADPGGKRIMSEARNNAVELLKMPDEAYFSAGDDRILVLQRALSKIYREAEMSGSRDAQPSIAIGAPRKAVSKDELPLLIATHQTGLRNWQVDPKQNLFVVATNLDTAQVRLARPLVPGKRERTPRPSASGVPPNESLAEQVSNHVQRLNVAGLWSDGLAPGRYALTVIIYDWLSNTVLVDWRPSKQIPAAETTQWVPEVLAQARDEPVPREGLAFHLPERVAAAAPVLLRASVSLPAGHLPRMRLEDRPEARLVPATVLLVRLDEPLAFSVDIGVPVKSVAQPTDRINAIFATDLRHAKRDELSAGTYRSYLIVGPDIAGPVPIVLE